MNFKTDQIITFVSYYLYDRPARIAAALNRIGLRPRLYLCSKLHDHRWERYFSSITYINAQDSGHILSADLKGPIHLFCMSVDILTVELLKARIPFFYDYKDVFPGNTNYQDDSISMQQQVLINLEYSGAAITYKDGQYNNFVSTLGLRRQAQTFFLPDFVWPSSYDALGDYLPHNIKSELKTVFIGNWTIERIEPENAGMGILPIIQSLLSQNIAFTLYPFRHDQADRDPEKMSDYISLANKNALFKIENRVTSNLLTDLIRSQSWGLFLTSRFHFTELRDKTYMRAPQAGIPGRFSDYFGAQLPVVVDSGFTECKRLVEDFGLGIVLEPGELESLRAKFSTIDRKLLQDNVRDYVECHLNPIKWAQRLMNYYGEYF